MLIAEGNVSGAVQYLKLLPPDRQLCSCLMKECSAASNIAGLQTVIQVRLQCPSQYFSVTERGCICLTLGTAILQLEDSSARALLYIEQQRPRGHGE